jgi:SAM-dependent methyltransferase
MNSMAFEERIAPSQCTHDLAELVIRYEFVSQMTACSSCTYFDLACGNGFGLKVLQCRAPNSILYGFDVSDEALGRAASYLGKPSLAHLIRMDLAERESYSAVETLLNNYPESRRVLICFDVVERLDDFTSFVTFINRQLQNGVETFLSVPNDAFWGMRSPPHKNKFGEESLSELIQLFDNPPKLYKEYSLRGATILPDSVNELTEEQMTGKLLPQFLDRCHYVSVPSHFVLHFSLSACATDSSFARFTPWDAAVERQRAARQEADLLYYKEEARRLRAEIEALQKVAEGRTDHS